MELFSWQPYLQLVGFVWWCSKIEIEKEFNIMWDFKTNRLGEWTPAVKRRFKVYEDGRPANGPGALINHESRSRFGYCYLEYKKKTS